MEPDVLIVGDDPETIQVLARNLGGLGKLRFAADSQTAQRSAREALPDLMLLDAETRDLNGSQVCDVIRRDPALAEIAMIIIAPEASDVATLEQGVADFIAKPISEPLLIARVKTQLRIKQLTDELRQISTIDSLTQLANRRRFDETVVTEWRRMMREGQPVSLLFVDVDHFSLYNDRHGRAAGDACLQTLARTLKGAIRRPADLAARIAGAQFALLLPHTPYEGAKLVAQRASMAIHSAGIPHGASPTAAHVTVSTGLAFYDDSSAAWRSRFSADTYERATAEHLLRAAEQALAAAKDAGRARVWRLDVADANAPISTACPIEAPTEHS